VREVVDQADDKTACQYSSTIPEFNDLSHHGRPLTSSCSTITDVLGGSIDRAARASAGCSISRLYDKTTFRKTKQKKDFQRDEFYTKTSVSNSHRAFWPCRIGHEYGDG
jgi:hypothetical protein